MKGIGREKVLLALVILAALFLRMYEWDTSLIEWHVLPTIDAARTFVRYHRIPLVGGQRIGSMGHYGPALEYFLAPFFLFSQSFTMFQLALLVTHLAAIYFLYRLGNEFFSREVGLLSAMLYAFSWFSLISSRRGANADFIPFFAVLLFYSLAKVVSAGKRQYVILAAGCLGMLLQLYFSAFPALPAALIILAVGYSKDKEKRKWLKPMAIGTALFLLMFLPYAVYEYRNGFKETVVRMEFAKAVLVGGDRSLPPQDSLALRVVQNAQGFFSFHPHHNPLGIDLKEDYLCEPRFADSGAHWTGPVYQIHWLLIRTEFALALIAFVVMLGSALSGSNQPFSRAHVSVVLLWFISAVAVLLVKPWGGIFHQTFAFPPLLILLSMFLSLILNLLTPWRKVLRAGIFGFCILLVLSSSILFLYATRKVADSSCVMNSLGDAPAGVIADLQKTLLSEFGTVPPVTFFRSLWGPQLSFSLIPRPETGASAPANMTFFFVRAADLLSGCPSGDFTYERQDGTLFGLSSSFSEGTRYSSLYTEGWQLKGFNDSSWPVHNAEGMLTFLVEDIGCDGCGPIVDHGPLFLRSSLPASSQAHACLLLLQHGFAHGIQDVYVNGAPVYGSEFPSTHGKGLMIDITKELIEGDNILAVRLMEVEKAKAMEPAAVSFGAFLMGGSSPAAAEAGRNDSTR